MSPADQLVAAILTPDDPSLPIRLSVSDRALLGRVEAGKVRRHWWPARVVDGVAILASIVDYDAVMERAVGHRMERYAANGLVVLDAARTTETDRLAGCDYESSRWRLTDAGRAARRSRTVASASKGQCPYPFPHEHSWCGYRVHGRRGGA